MKEVFNRAAVLITMISSIFLSGCDKDDENSNPANVQEANYSLVPDTIGAVGGISHPWTTSDMSIRDYIDNGGDRILWLKAFSEEGGEFFLISEADTGSLAGQSFVLLNTNFNPDTVNIPLTSGTYFVSAGGFFVSEHDESLNKVDGHFDVDLRTFDSPQIDTYNVSGTFEDMVLEN